MTGNSETQPVTSAWDARRGLLLVLSSPSGAGKTTLSRRLLGEDAQLTMSVSVTTRDPRPGEIDGRDYWFRDVAGFEKMRDAGDLLEWAKVHGNFYGTPAGPVMAELDRGRDVLFDIDWQGAQQLAAKAGSDVVRIFILPPSADTLRRRLETRAQDKPEVVARRLAGAAEEITHWDEYDYVLVNEDVDRCMDDLRAVLAAERLKRTRREGLKPLVETLLARLPAV
ncbi:MAG: guanylate kinase [Hyphomicrobiaceae bacterium]